MLLLHLPASNPATKLTLLTHLSLTRHGLGGTAELFAEGAELTLFVIAEDSEFSGYGLRALQFGREAVQRALDVPLHEGLRMEADLSTLAYRTADAEEGMQAFVEKRKAAFKDQ